MSLVERQYDDFVWGLKNRPKKVKDIVLPQRLKNQFLNIVETKNIPNMLLSGTRGCGKTTTAFCIADEVGCDVLYVNMSKDNSIDMVREKLTRFATSMGFEEGKKLIIGDEFDRLSINAIDALKGDIEQFSNNCSFVFTSNNKHKFIDHPVMSRLQEIDFEFSKDEMRDMMKQFFKIVCTVLKKEKVKFETKAVGMFIKSLFPDMRKILNELQKISSQFDGKITVEAIDTITSVSDINILFDALKEKDFGYIREFISRLTIDPSQFYSVMFKKIENFVAEESLPGSIVTLSEYQYKSAFSLDKQIPLTACMIELMSDCEWE
jgi:replication factor C small subunit